MVLVWEQVRALCIAEGFEDQGLSWQRAPRVCMPQLCGSETECLAWHGLNLACMRKRKENPRRGNPGRKSRSG